MEHVEYFQPGLVNGEDDSAIGVSQLVQMREKLHGRGSIQTYMHLKNNVIVSTTAILHIYTRVTESKLEKHETFLFQIVLRTRIDACISCK